MKSRIISLDMTRQLQSGLTLVELLIGLTAVAVIFVLASPGFSALLRNHHIESTAGELAITMNLASSEATRRYSTVRVCPSSDGVSCRQDGDWNRGWLVFSDGNANGVPEKIEIIKAFGSPNQKVRVRSQGAIVDVAIFTIAGLSGNDSFTEGAFRVCHVESTSVSRTVSVNQDGWVDVAESDKSCENS
jgi:type IV fimbrial biogenesis protein FimT